MPTFRIRRLAILAAAVCVPTPRSQALIISNGYAAVLDDRFVSGYAAAPVANTNSAFLAWGYNLSGVGWNVSNPTQSAAALSPRNLLQANHYVMPLNGAGDSGNTLAFLAPGATTPIGDYVKSAVAIGSTIDLNIATLGTELPASIQVYSLLDTGVAGNYTGQPLLMYGHGAAGPLSSPRIGNNIVAGAFGGAMGNQLYFSTAGSMPNLATPESGDSQSPLFIPHINPVSGQRTLTLIGAQWTTAYSSFVADPARLAAINAVMTPTGYALLWTPATVDTSWTGALSSNWSNAGNWTNGLPAASAYICFDPTTAAQAFSRSITLGADRTVVGIYFKAGTAGRPFTINSGSVLNIGRGGIVNYDAAAQTINAVMSFNDNQNWLAGSGGMVVTGTLFNNGYLLSINTAGNSSLGGLMTGAGGLAKDGAGTLTVSASQLFTGPVFAHNGVINVTHPQGLSAGNVSIDPGATVRFAQPSAQAATLTSLSMSAGATLDINSAVLMPTANVTARDALFTTLKAALQTGRNGGAWNGTGLTSSLAKTLDAALGKQVFEVALVKNSDLSYPFDSASHRFAGVAANPLSILMKYTYAGDTDLDGRITVDDYLNIDVGAAEHKPASWATGDFNYDGTVNALDYALIDTGYLSQGGTLAMDEIQLHATLFGQPYIDAFNSIVAAPEPGSLALLALGGAWAFTQRRRGRACVR